VQGCHHYAVVNDRWWNNPFTIYFSRAFEEGGNKTVMRGWFRRSVFVQVYLQSSNFSLLFATRRSQLRNSDLSVLSTSRVVILAVLISR
jgi:hypothetical protein